MQRSPDRAEAGSYTSTGEEKETSACQSCRKRKLKCSRDSPTCSQCTRLSCTCLYDYVKQKPGVKTGAIESLNRRVESLEKLLLDGNGNLKAGPIPVDQPGCVYHASLLLAKELQDNDENSKGLLLQSEEAPENLSRRHCGLGTKFVFGAVDQRWPSKKRKTDHVQLEDNLLERNWEDTEKRISSLLPSVKTLGLVLDTFYSIIHPWVPIIHLNRFREQFNDPEKRPNLEIILHAMVYATMKYLKEEDIDMEKPEIARQVQLSRNMVMLTATDRLTIQNIQALTIIAFHDIGSGNISRAWPIIGSLTRTVEYLQLTIEADEAQQYSLSTPLVLLDKPSDWVESEIRRRTFWNVFLLDRLCSIITGWNTSLTSDDVRRRLPCDGTLFQHGEEAVMTPYFGIWNKSAAKIGNSVAYIPAHYPSPNHPTDPRSPNAIPEVSPVDTSKLGAFAYHIEATESLSQVTTFFLQQKVDFRNREEVGSWLTRFKELDLRLVHWKMFLPQKWKDSNISRDKAFINMDPNLTTAHLTHNTSMILLHQHIAYPPPEWEQFIRLPSLCSAGTCESAAVETASICEKFIKYTEVGIVSSQFALCAFVAARVLLVHWRYYQTALLPEFFSLLSSLENMSARWRDPHAEKQSLTNSSSESDLDIAGQYLLHLQTLHRKCTKSPDFRMDANLGGLLPPMGSSGPSSGIAFSPAVATGGMSANASQDQMRNGTAVSQSHTQAQIMQQKESPQPQSQISSSYPNQRPYYDTTTSPQHVRSPNVSLQNHQQFRPQTRDKPYTPSLPSYPPASNYFSSTEGISTSPSSNPNPPALSGGGDTSSIQGMSMGISNGRGDLAVEHGADSLTEMSNLLLGQQFMEMDRVITFEETDFTLPWA